MAECARLHPDPLTVALALCWPPAREAFLAAVRLHGERLNGSRPERLKLFTETHPPEAEPEELPKP